MSLNLPVHFNVPNSLRLVHEAKENIQETSKNKEKVDKVKKLVTLPSKGFQLIKYNANVTRWFLFMTTKFLQWIFCIRSKRQQDSIF